MPIFTIVFERRAADGAHDYRPLTDELQSHKCFPLWEQAWLGAFENNAAQVHNYFRKLLAAEDRLVVCEMTDRFCYSGVVGGANRWLELNPPGGPAKAAAKTARAAPAPGAKSGKAPASKAATAGAPAAAKASGTGAKKTGGKPSASAKRTTQAAASATAPRGGKKAAEGKSAGKTGRA